MLGIGGIVPSRPVSIRPSATRALGGRERPDDATAAALRRALAELPEVRLAWLFGSQATGSARPDSDADVAVLVDSKQSGESEQSVDGKPSGDHDAAVERAVEAALDLANHWIAGRRLGTPEANRDSFTLLERAGEIPPDLADRLRAWAGFRYVLVHEYLEIDHAISYRALTTELGDLEAFARWAAGKLESARRVRRQPEGGRDPIVSGSCADPFREPHPEAGAP